jgi:RNA polymerase sigma-70 factor (ECF subfamily)
MPAVDTIRLAGKLGAFAQTHQRGAGGLFERAQQGDQEAFSLLFEQYAKPISNFIYRMVGSGDLAEDLAQETFVRAYKKIRTLHLHDDTQLSTWLFSIAKNVVRESFRSRRIDQNKVGIDDVLPVSIRGDEPAPDERLWNKELQHMVQQGLQKLDPDKRQVFILRVFQQCSYDEIAAITGYSMPKLKADLYRARTQMRDWLRPYLEQSNEL